MTDKHINTQTDQNTQIAASAIEATVQELYDENFIEMDKVGTSNYYWAFQSQASVKKIAEMENIEKKIIEIDNTIEKTKDRIENELQSRQSVICDLFINYICILIALHCYFNLFDLF